MRDYRNDHVRLFTINQAEFVSKAAKGKLNTKEADTLAPVLVGYAKSTETYRSWQRVSGATERLYRSSTSTQTLDC
ncbi:hypothetical protein [Xenorhabdus sp. NBAII XenSa04]|uniref:hypothetical protein n=1 Tax=Xenorhabdus TaxID=626 RepID=UPI00350F7A8A